jgi:exopolysaccharide production protein ExoF
MNPSPLRIDFIYPTRQLMAVVAGLLLSAFCWSAARADDYQLGPADKLSIKVVEWQAAEGVFRDWPAITGEYTISPTGTLAVPFGGEIKAGGKTTSEVAAALAKSLQQKLGLVTLPEASVQVSQFRPVFVAGDVQTPGQLPFMPEMTVMKAVSVAGGMRRGAETSQRFERDFLSARGNYDVLIAERDRLLIRRARLQAELNEETTIKPPPGLSPGSATQKLISDEAAIMRTRKNSLDLQLNAIEELKRLYQGEITSLEKKMVVQGRQMELIRKELANVGGLADRGLVVSSRVMGLETSVADMESKLLDLGTASLRAKQEINKANRNASDLENERKAELATELQKTESALDENRLRITMYKDLMTEVAVNAPAALSVGDGSAPTMQYSIIRMKNGQPTEMTATETTALIPGDVVRVTVAQARPPS